MAEYNGSIELIAGLKPKNNGNFPLVNAPDVLMPDGKRLSEIDFENLGGGGALAVTFTDVNIGDDMTGTATASHTASEIKAAHDSGKYVYASIDIMGEGIPYYLPLVVSFANDDFSMAAFAIHAGEAFVQVMVADGNSAEIAFIREGSGGGGDTFPVPFGLNTETIDATCEVSYSEIATAVEEGKFVYGILDWVGMPVVLPFKGILSIDGNYALFETALDFMGLQMSVLIHENGEIETRASQITDGDGGGDSVAETFPVSFVVDPADFTATCDKTFAEIYSAVGEGKFIYGRFTIMGAVEYLPFMIPFIGFGEDSQPFALFEGTYEMMGMKGRIAVLADGTVETEMSQITSGGESAAPSVPPTGVDMSRFESDGIIEETYADGSMKTTTIEYDSTGNPVKITDGDGNVTEFTW